MPSKREFAVIGVVVALIAVGALWFLGGQIDEITTSIDDAMISDSQQERLDEIPAISSCDTLRVYVAFSQEIITGDGATDEGYFGTPYGERLGEAAEAQLDKLRCGG